MTPDTNKPYIAPIKLSKSIVFLLKWDFILMQLPAVVLCSQSANSLLTLMYFNLQVRAIVSVRNSKYHDSEL